MSKYIGQFKDLNNKDYKIEITSSTGSKNESVILGCTPFTTTMKQNDSIYESVKTSGATITILTDKFPADIYSGSALGTKVHVTSGDKVVWTGYLTPSAYTQGYDLPLEELQLECVDGLSVLQSIPYTSASKDVADFLSIVFKCLKKSNCYKNLYVCNVVQRISIWNNDSPLEAMKISEGNFFDEKDYEAQPDTDVAWNCFDVLYEISQYLGYSMIAHGEDVYMLDYDAMLNTDNVYKSTYIHYDISGVSPVNKGSVTLTHSYKVKEGSYAETGNSIELTEVFNKLTIKDSFYEIEDQFEAVGNVKNLTNITDKYDIWDQLQQNDSGHYKECALFTERNKQGIEESFFIMIYKPDNMGKYLVIGKFYENPALQCYHYKSSSNNSVVSESNFNPFKYSYLSGNKGAQQVGYFVQKIEDSHYDSWKSTLGTWRVKSLEDKLKAFAKLLNIANIQNKQLTNYILCLNQSENHISHDDVKKYPFFKISKDVSLAHGGEGAYIVLKGELIRHNKEDVPFPTNGDSYYHKDEKKTSAYSGEAYFWARLKWGNNYWYNDDYKTQGKWLSTPCDFKIYYGDPTKEQRLDVLQDKALKFFNTASMWGVDEDGIVIPCPEGEVTTGKIEFVVYCNNDTKGHWARNNRSDKKNSYSGFPPRVVLLKDLSLELGWSDDALNEEAASSDTYYTNECEYPNVNEADEIEFKVCTNDEKKASYSVVTCNGIGETTQYVDKMYRKDNQLCMRQEEHYIYKFVNQYAEPKVIYKCNLKTDIGLLPYSIVTANQFPGKKFIIDSISTDYRFNKSEISLVQK